MSTSCNACQAFIPKLLLAFLLIILGVRLPAQEPKSADSSGTNSNPVSSVHEADEEEGTGSLTTEEILDFNESSILQSNQFGSYGLRINGIKGAVKTDKYGFVTSYDYQNWDGYRAHSNDYRHNLNVALGTTPSSNTSLKILGSFLHGITKLPGSLTKTEFDNDPMKAGQRSIDRDEKNLSTTGRLDIIYDAKFGRRLNHEIEISTFGSISFFERATKEYRIISRYGLGLSGKYINSAKFGERENKLTAGFDLSTEPERTEDYDNFSGQKGDMLEQLSSETKSSNIFYLSDNFEILPEKLLLLLTGRYDNDIYKVSEQTVPSRSDRRTFNAFTPKIGLDWKATPWLDFDGAFYLGFESPAGRQLESPDPFYLYNPTLSSQTSQNYEAGFRIRLSKKDSSFFFRKFMFRTILFQRYIDNEIVSYEVLGDEYYRNAGRSDRFGIELEGMLEIIKGLTFSASYTYSHFVYRSYTGISVETDSTNNIVQVNRDFSGNSVPSVPENLLEFALGYTHSFGKKISTFVKVTYDKTDAMWVDDLNSSRTDSYDLLNASLGADMKFGHFKLAVTGGVNNIFDRVYVGYITQNSADYRFYNAGEPVNFAGTFNIAYIF